MKKITITIIWLLSLYSCTKEEITSRYYPRVLSHPADYITSSSATFHGEIIYSMGAIVEHGFIWSTFPSMTISQGTVIKLGQKTGVGNFQSGLQFNFTRGTKYYVMGFAQASGYTVYGNVVEFMIP
jgi:hypothetical protein